jgi:hypothetical protein
MVNGNHVEAFARAFKGARLSGCAHVVVNAEPKRPQPAEDSLPRSA